MNTTRATVHALLSTLLITAVTPNAALAQGAPKKAAPAPTAKPAPAPAAKPKPLSETLKDSAKTDYLAGKILFDDGDFATALQKFEAAHAAQPDPRLLFNIAAAQKNLRHYTRAAKLFRQYLNEGGDLLTAEDRAETTELLKVIDELTVPMNIVVSEPGAQVFMDGELLGTSPLPSPVVLDIGQRKFTAQKDGFRQLQTIVQVGPVRDVKLTLERQRARLELSVPAVATVSLDDKPLGKGPLVQVDDLPVGGHALRITAPRMRPYQGEVVLEDGKTRTLQIDLEPDLEQYGEIRVAVGCSDPRIRTHEDGLTVFLDNGNESASALGVRKRVVDGAEIPAYVPYSVAAGEHRVRVRIPGCQPLEIEANAGPLAPADVTGMLPPERPWFNGTPAGSPNGWRVSAGFSTASIGFKNFEDFFPKLSQANASRYHLALSGPSISGGLLLRWFTLVADARLLFGSSGGSVTAIDETTGSTTPVQASKAASFTLLDGGLRLGPRIPIHSASISGGAGGSIGNLRSKPDATKDADESAYVRPFVWAQLDAQPLCDFGLGGGFQFGPGIVAGKHNDAHATTDFGIFVHVSYQPNILCTRKRNGLYRLDTAQVSAAAPAK